MSELITAAGWHQALDRDVRVELAPGLVLCLRYLDWDTRFFGLPSYLLDWSGSGCPDTVPGKEELLRIAATLPKAVVWAKLPLEVPQAFLSILEGMGARYIETEMNLRHDDLRRPLRELSGVSFFKADSLSLPGYPELSQVYTVTRFHMDPQVPAGKADGLWLNYFRNYPLGTKKHAFIAAREGVAVGVVLISIREEGGVLVNDVDIVAVSNSAKSGGVGSRLMQEAIAWCLDSGRPSRVSSQHRNVAAVNYYLRNGFTIFDPPRAVFHWWTSN